MQGAVALGARADARYVEECVDLAEARKAGLHGVANAGFVTHIGDEAIGLREFGGRCAGGTRPRRNPR